MKKLLMAFVACLAGTAWMFAQPATETNKFKVSFGPVFDFPKKHVDLGFIGTKEDGIVQLSYKRGSDLTIQKLDNKLAVSKTQSADISKMPGSFISDDFRKVGNHYYWFYSTWDKKAEKEHLHTAEIDVKNGKMGAEKDLITATKLTGTLIMTGFYQFNKANKYHFRTATDSSNLLVTYILEHTTKDDSKSKEVVGFNMFDASMTKLWNKEVQMPYTEEMMDIEDYAVDKSGNGYVLAKVFEGKKKEKTKDGTPNYHFELLRQGSSGELKSIPIKLDKYFINSIDLSEDFDGNMVCIGYYSNQPKNSSDGVFAVKIDKDGNIKKVHHGYYEFPTEIIKEFMSARQQKKIESKEKNDGKDVEVSSLKLKNVVLNSDGSIMVGGEVFYYTVTVNSSSKGSTTTYYHYFYNDILVMKIGADGEMAWCRKVPKRQTATTTYYTSNVVGNTSYDLEAFNGDYYFYYTDNVKNLNLTPDKVPAYHVNGAGGFLVYSRIDKDGKVTKGKFFDYREKKFNLIPNDFIRVGDNMIINRAFNKGKSQVLTISM
jgi:hypothetical protein